MRSFLESKAGMTVLLFVGLLVFSIAVIVCAVELPSNERIFAFLTGIAGNFSGALFTYLQLGKDRPPNP